MPRNSPKISKAFTATASKSKKLVSPMMFYSALLAEGINELLAATLTEQILSAVTKTANAVAGQELPETEIDHWFHDQIIEYGYIAPGDHFQFTCTLNNLIYSSHKWPKKFIDFWCWLTMDIRDNYPAINNFQTTGKPTVVVHKITGNSTIPNN